MGPSNGRRGLCAQANSSLTVEPFDVTKAIQFSGSQ